MKKKVIILGSTGSIGASALDVIRSLKSDFDVAALCCRSSVGKLVQQVEEFRPEAVAVTGEPAGTDRDALARLGKAKVYRKEEGLLQMLTELEADVVLNGISGAKGLLPSLASLQAGKDLALANKETIVMAGPLIMSTVREKGLNLLPVDSEHHALFTLLRQRRDGEVNELILTASGGAFRELSYRELEGVGVEAALEHPSWKMGAKITVDSATLANKGLEVIEAHYLFGFSLQAIKVLIHPQSYAHSLIRTVDGFLYTQISRPDMRLAIQSALTYPDVVPSSFSGCDLAGQALTFEAVDQRKYRLLPLAYQVAAQAGGYPVVYNAANELAVQQFLNREIAFLEIAAVVEEALQRDWSVPVASIEQILDIDREARRKTTEILEKKKRIA